MASWLSSPASKTYRARSARPGAIDGIHNKFEELIYIIVPQMKPMLLFGAVNAIIGAFAIYDVPLTLAGNPGPDNAALTLIGHLNDYAFTRLDLGYGLRRRYRALPDHLRAEPYRVPRLAGKGLRGRERNVNEFQCSSGNHKAPPSPYPRQALPRDSVPVHYCHGSFYSIAAVVHDRSILQAA